MVAEAPLDRSRAFTNRTSLGSVQLLTAQLLDPCSGCIPGVCTPGACAGVGLEDPESHVRESEEEEPRNIFGRFEAF